jgi:4-amino-4-deoxychorismate lyase
MFRLIETIKVIDGLFQNLHYHNSRLNKARKELFNAGDKLDIEKLVHVPASICNGIYKCTVTYNKEISEINFQLYTIKKIRSLKIVTDNDIDYSYKYADRTNLNTLLELKGDCDEIVIVRNNQITDTSFTNLIFFDGEKWYTPDSPLLKGTKREKLLQQGIITETNINIDDLTKYSQVGLINAMLEPGDITIDITNLKL